MTTTANAILESALALSDDERANIAERLFESLVPPGILCEDDPGFFQELERRSADYRAGRTTASDWADVQARIREALKQRIQP